MCLEECRTAPGESSCYTTNFELTYGCLYCWFLSCGNVKIRLQLAKEMSRHFTIWAVMSRQCEGKRQQAVWPVLTTWKDLTITSVWFSFSILRKYNNLNKYSHWSYSFQFGYVTYLWQQNRWHAHWKHFIRFLRDLVHRRCIKI